MIYKRKATLCMKNIEQTQKKEEEENREKTKKKTNQHDWKQVRPRWSFWEDLKWNDQLY